VGAGLGILALVLFALSYFVDGFSEAGFTDIFDNMTIIELASKALAALGAFCLLVSPLVGWIAVSQIRRSAGKIYGMWLAVFDSLLFPLLALDGLIVGAFYLGLLLADEHLIRSQAAPIGIPFLLLIPVVLGVVALADFFITHRVWRAVNNLSAPQQPTNKPMNSNLKKTTDIAIVPLTVIACIVAVWFLFLKSSAHPPGLVAAWSGSSNGQSGKGAVLKNVKLTEGVTGKAFSFDPQHARGFSGVLIPDAPAYALTHSLSMVAWIQPRGNGYMIFFRGDHRPGLDPYGLSMQGNHDLRFWICGTSNDDSAFIDAKIPYFVWTHVVATLDGSTGTMNLYTNGVLAAQTNTTVRPFGELQADQSPGIGIGNVNDGGNNFPFNGEIDGITLYDRALSAKEVEASYLKYAAKAESLNESVSAPNN
jgi:hypothetical protein